MPNISGGDAPWGITNKANTLRGYGAIKSYRIGAGEYSAEGMPWLHFYRWDFSANRSKDKYKDNLDEVITDNIAVRYYYKAF